MAVNYYDDAILNRVKSWVKDESLVILSPEDTTRLIQTKADQNNDKPLSLPLIAISRKPEIRIINTKRQPKSYDGFKIRAYDKKGNEVRFKSTYKLRAIPIQLEYQIDVYAAHLKDSAEYAREFTFKLVNKPTITIEIPYNNVKLTHNSTIQLEDVIEDNSDIPERAFPTQFTRFTLTFTVDDAYFFSAVNKDNIEVSEFEIVAAEDDFNGTDVEILSESTI